MKGLIFILTNKEAEQVDVYIEELLSPKQGEYDEIDDFIVVCSCDVYILRQLASLTNHYINKLTEIINIEFLKYKGVTLSMIAAQERLYQLKVLLNKINGKDSVHELAMLCIASSVDLNWLQTQNK